MDKTTNNLINFQQIQEQFEQSGPKTYAHILQAFPQDISLEEAIVLLDSGNTKGKVLTEIFFSIVHNNAQIHHPVLRTFAQKIRFTLSNTPLPKIVEAVFYDACRVMDKKTASLWDLLPCELWAAIFSLLSRRDLKNSNLTCRKFHDILTELFVKDGVIMGNIFEKKRLVDLYELKKDNFPIPPFFDDQTLNKILDLRNLVTYIDLSSMVVTSEHIENILKFFPNLESLKLGEINNSVLQAISNLSRLNSLGWDSYSYPRDDTVFQTLSKLTNLRVFREEDDAFTDIGLQTLGNLTNLRSLQLNSDSITDIGFQALSKLTNLRSLALFHGKNITGAGLQVISGLTNLESLEISSFRRISDAELYAAVSGLKQLQSLNIMACTTLTGAGIKKVLDCLDNLKSLDLYFVNITDEDLFAIENNLKRLESFTLGRNDKLTNTAIQKVLSGLTNLQSLDITASTQINDENIEAIVPNLTNLQSLIIRETHDEDHGHLQTTNKGLEAMSRYLPQLQSLDITGCRLSVAAMQSLENFTNLQSLYIDVWESESSKEFVTKEEIRALHGLTHLKSLWLGCYGMDDTAFQAFCDMPNLQSLTIYASAVNRSAARQLKDLGIQVRFE